MAMELRDWKELIEDFWWDRYGRVYKKMNERTHLEIEELAARVAKAHEREMRELEGVL